MTKTIQADPDGANLDGGVDLLSPVMSYQYDAVGNQVAVTDARGFTTRREFDSFNQTVAAVDALGNRTRIVYDRGGQMIASVDALGRSAYSQYDDRGRIVLQRSPDPDGASVEAPASVRYRYDAAGRLIEQVDASGYGTEYAYDALDRRTAERYVISEVVDNGDPEFTINSQGPGQTVGDALSFGRDAILIAPPTSGPGLTAEGVWTFSNLAPGVYRVSATWRGHAQAGTTVSAYITNNYDENTGQPVQFWPADSAKLGLSQQAPPPGMRRNDDRAWRNWVSLGDQAVTLGQGPQQIGVMLVGAANQSLYVDAVRIERLVETKFTYDANGNLLTTTDALGNLTTRKYDELDRLISVQDPEPKVIGPNTGSGLLFRPLTTTTYDGYGNVASTIENRGGGAAIRTTANVYDARNRLLRQTEDAGVDGATNYVNNVTEFQYDAVDNLVETREITESPATPGQFILQRRTAYAYDALGRRTRGTVNSDGNNAVTTVNERLTVTHYDAAGNVERVERNPGVDTRNVVTTNEYDALGRPTQTTESGVLLGVAEARATRFVYDAVGNVITTIDPLGRVAYSSYNGRDRLTTSTAPDPDGSGFAGGAVTTYRYDAAGRLVTKTNSDDEADRTIYNAQGLAARTYNGKNEETRRRFDVVGNMVSFADPAGQVTTYKYDGLGRLAEDETVTGTRKYFYDLAGNLTLEVDRNDRAVRRSYDRLSRPTLERWFANETDARVNSPSSQLTAYSAQITTAYDPLGRRVETQFLRRKPNTAGTAFVNDTLVTDSWQFDGLDRMIEHSNQSLTPSATTNSYDAPNVAAPAAKQTYAYSYAPGNFLIERREFVGSLAQADASTISFVGPFGAVRYVIDQAVSGGSLTFARADADFIYDRTGALSAIYRKTDYSTSINQFKNFVETTYAYDGAGRLASLAHSKQTHAGYWPGYQGNRI